ncbi:MAG: T9SS type A sorting domain-containing protein [Bacteroides sp.]|nr:T9SS type A sorting domain-containing protein [Bacteroides sp.]
MNAKFIRALPLGVMLLFSPFFAKADTTASLVVVEKDGTIVETPIPDVSRIDFDTFSFSVLSKDGNSEKYDYDSVKRIEFGSTSGIALPSKDVRLAVWPTVTSSTLNVTGTEANDMIYVFGLNGTQEISVTASDDVNVIDVSGLAAGHYVVKAGNTSVRFIKK